MHDILNAVGVKDADELRPRELSGGMLRRVALARAIIRKPQVLLCDEPFSGLDPTSIRHIESLLMQINQKFGITMIVVSHDIHSTLRMADHVLLILPDHVLEGTPAEMLSSDDPQAVEFLRTAMHASWSRKSDDKPYFLSGLSGDPVRGGTGCDGLVYGGHRADGAHAAIRFEAFVTASCTSLEFCRCSSFAFADWRSEWCSACRGITRSCGSVPRDRSGRWWASASFGNWGPCSRAVLVAGRAGSATTAEIGTMVATEQLDGLRMLSIDPVSLIIKPKAEAMLFVTPLLTALFIVCGLYGGYLVGVVQFGGDPGSYMSSLRSNIDFHNDIACSIVKSATFGLLLGPDRHLPRIYQHADC